MPQKSMRMSLVEDEVSFSSIRDMSMIAILPTILTSLMLYSLQMLLCEHVRELADQLFQLREVCLKQLERLSYWFGRGHVYACLLQQIDTVV